MKTRKNKIKEAGKLFALSGCFFLFFSFILFGSGSDGILQTRMVGKQISFDQEGLSWEALAAVTLSFALIISGTIMFFADDKKRSNK